MLHGFIDFLDDYLTDTGIAGLIRATLGILAFASLLSAVFGTTAIKAGALVIATLCLLGVLVLLTTHHRTLRSQAGRHRLLLSHYCAVLTDQMDHMWHIHHWSEVIDIAPNGDEKGSITIHATVDAEVLHFLRIVLGAHCKQPVKMRAKVHSVLAAFEVEGVGRTRWSETFHWLEDGRLEILAHCLSTPPVRGDRIRLRLDYTWPGKSATLMQQDEPDAFTILVSRSLDHLNYRITLPPGTRVDYDAIGLVEDQDDFDLSGYFLKRGQPIVELIAHDVEADHRVGMRLHLRN